MEIQSSNTFSQDVRALAKADDKKENGPIGPQVAELDHAKNADKAELRLNAKLLESALEVTVNAGNNPQALVLKTAIEGINEALQETLGDNAIQNTYDSGLDVSPGATADRIVSLSTAFFGAYQEANPDLDQEQALTAFIDVIRGGIEQGFSEARDVLDSLSVLEGDIATNIDSTYDLVLEGLSVFVANFNQAEPEPVTEEQASV
jgi:hypothetical protein